MVERTDGLRNTEEAAAWLGITVATLHRLTEAGEITFRVVGRNHRYTVKDLEDYLEAHRVPRGSLTHLAGERKRQPVARHFVPRKSKVRVSQVRRQGQPNDRVPRDPRPRPSPEELRAARVSQRRARKEAAKQAADRRSAEAAAVAAARRQEVVHRYLGGISVEEIARELEVGTSLIYRDLRVAGVPRRQKRTKGGPYSLADVLTRAYLTEEYEQKKRSVQELAREASCSQSTVLNWLRRYEIEIRRR